MSDLQLVIGNRNYSSWSLRAWLALRKTGVEFETVLIPLDTPEFTERIAEYSPTGRVPVLWHEGLCVWDSLAIAEYVNEQFADGRLWPADSASRALGRSMIAEMHSGFTQLRMRMPMNCRASNRIIDMDASLQEDLDRMWTLWSDSLTSHADVGSWLLGEFSIADAMFAPVVMRFQAYDIKLPADIKSYCDHVLNDEHLQEWLRGAAQETWVVAADEAGVDQE
ncbi:MAG: glutathione S-transferase family protein [Halioglobus sp.]